MLIYHNPQSFWAQIKNRKILKNLKKVKLRFSYNSQVSDEELKNFVFWKIYQLLYYLYIEFFQYKYEGEFWYIISSWEDKKLNLSLNHTIDWNWHCTINGVIL